MGSAFEALDDEVAEVAAMCCSALQVLERLVQRPESTKDRVRLATSQTIQLFNRDSGALCAFVAFAHAEPADGGMS